MNENTLKLGLPKGSLQETTLSLMEKAGFRFSGAGRSYYLNSDDETIEARMVRSQEMAPYVQDGHFDAGITGLDWVRETGSDVVTVADLIYSKASMRPCKWVLAVPDSSGIKSVKDLEGKSVATEVVNLARGYFKENGVKVDVEFSWGATEIKAPDFVDAIVEITETGNSLRANKLRIVDTILETNTQLIANKAAWENPWKREKLESIAMLLQAAIAAEGKVGLKMNVKAEDLDKVIAILPAITSPTISQLSDERWVAVETIIEEKTVRECIPALKRAGAAGIVEYPLNKVID